MSPERTKRHIIWRKELRDLLSVTQFTFKALFQEGLCNSCLMLWKGPNQVVQQKPNSDRKEEKSPTAPCWLHRLFILQAYPLSLRVFVQWSEGRWFDPRPLQSTCCRHTHMHCCSVGVWVHVWGSHCHQCTNVCEAPWPAQVVATRCWNVRAVLLLYRRRIPSTCNVPPVQ